MKTLYLMRHGETLFNVQHRIQGASDSPLTANGIAQAKAAKDFYQQRNIHFNTAAASTQERAVDTLELITDQPYQRLKGLKEWNFGVFEGQSETLNPKHPGEASYGNFFAEHGYGGEAMTQVQVRMVATLTDLMQHAKGDNVLAVSHGGAMHAFLLHYLAWPMTGYDIYTGNCAILQMSFDGEFHFVASYNPLQK
ncbi:histidine phosphatase family protein [Lacticaseibacillus zhaodongensis]|uniref:histidine phosphatase family protein n=1 Tax=Lacticaseibacillus zhaodongensis TaxID=2668065 RepID=UPI0012D2AF2D|nr:histidine phosphatase family protein [Lacticaseibacillus zhaodongensis]